MSFRVETVILSPDTDQYRGEAHETTTISDIARIARETEELGFDRATTPEAGNDPFLPLALVAEHTSRIGLGTNVAIAFPRSPLVTAQVAWDLQRLSGGRFQLGLGSQVKGHNERRYASPWTGGPGPRLRDYVLCLKAIFEAFQSGKPPSFQSENYRFDLMPPFFNPGPIEHPHIPITLAAVNTYMARLAGELCDGIRLHPIAGFRYAREVIVPAIETGAQRAGRDPSEVELIGAPFLAVAADDEGVEKARQGLKQHIAFYASTRTYHSVLEFHGWTDVGAGLHRLSVEGRWSEMSSLITDEMLEEFAIIARADGLVDEVRRRCAGLFPTVLLDLPPVLRADQDWVQATVRALQA